MFTEPEMDRSELQYPRRPRVLWACLHCLLDSTSGASLSVRQMLKQLVGRGFAVQSVGATIFDHSRGAEGFRGRWGDPPEGQPVEVVDGPLRHILLPTRSPHREELTQREQDLWIELYQQALDRYRPDLVWFYGGRSADLVIPAEARARGVPAAAYVVNGNYHGVRWCRDVDVVITDTQATADLYRQRIQRLCEPVGKFVDPRQYLAGAHTRERLLFINPTLAKGAALVAALAIRLNELRPDITFEVVEARGHWQRAVASVTAARGFAVSELPNVIVTPNCQDMRPVYQRARLLLAPSLWWESGARVVVEALINGIPALITDHGGLPELVQGAGIQVRLPESCHRPPYSQLPEAPALERLAHRLIEIHDDEALYRQLVARALHVARTVHDLQRNTQRLVTAIAPLLARGLGDADPNTPLASFHRHGLG